MTTADLFSSSDKPAFETLVSDSGSLAICRRFIDQGESREWFTSLQQEIEWEPRKITLYGKSVSIPRLSAWYGDKSAVYRYSGILHLPKPWTPLLHTINTRLETVLDIRFDAVLLNLYRNEQDSVAWHSDDEPELTGKIASLSFGETRRFQLKPRDAGADQKICLDLAEGDLLLMDERFQQHWLHCIPKNRQPCAPRINLTFRQLKTLDSGHQV